MSNLKYIVYIRITLASEGEKGRGEGRVRGGKRKRFLQIWFLQQFGPAAARIAVAIGT